MNRKWAETHPARGEAPPSITHDFSYVRTPDSDGDSGCSNSLRTTDNVKFIAVVTALPFPSLHCSAPITHSVTRSAEIQSDVDVRFSGNRQVPHHGGVIFTEANETSQECLAA